LCRFLGFRFARQRYTGIVNNNPGSVCSEFLGYATADPSTGTGNYRDLAF
jgi:hypothetical protein